MTIFKIVMDPCGEHGNCKTNPFKGKLKPLMRKMLVGDMFIIPSHKLLSFQSNGFGYAKQLGIKISISQSDVGYLLERVG